MADPHKQLDFNVRSQCCADAACINRDTYRQYEAGNADSRGMEDIGVGGLHPNVAR